MNVAIRTTSKSVRSKEWSGSSRPHVSPAKLDFRGLLGRFSEALAVIRIVARVLDAAEQGTEAAALHSGLAALDRVYAELDQAISQLSADSEVAPVS